MLGFQALRPQGSGNSQGQMDSYTVDAAHLTRLAIGDAAKLTGVGTSTGAPTCDGATVGSNQILGVIAGFEVNPDNLTSTGLAASTGGVARVIIDSDMNYRVNVTGTVLAAADVGSNIDTTITAATETGGITISNMAVNGDSKGTTAVFPWRIVAVEEDSAGVFGRVAIVRPNNAALNAGTIGV